MRSSAGGESHVPGRVFEVVSNENVSDWEEYMYGFSKDRHRSVTDMSDSVVNTNTCLDAGCRPLGNLPHGRESGVLGRIRRGRWGLPELCADPAGRIPVNHHQGAGVAARGAAGAVLSGSVW